MDKDLLDDILESILESYEDISDINITSFRAFQVEHESQLTEIKTNPKLALNALSPYQTFLIALTLIGKNERLLTTLLETGSADLAYDLREKVRFRVNIFSSSKNYSIVLRRLENTIPTIESLKAPSIFSKIIHEKNGLVLVTGSTGSGKSTTLAAMLRDLNETKSVHILTLEDPIEFVHESIKSTFNQRELGVDYDNFSSGLRAALRQAPKVILVGEMRDRETLEIGLTASETGHLVVSTMHTIDAGQTINRIIGMFDKDQEEQVRRRLAESLRWVVCQRLVRKINGGRIAIHEIMGSNLRTSELILYGEDESKTFHNVIEASEPLGWQTFESCLTRLFENGIITEEEAMFNSSRKNLLRLRIDYIKNKQNIKTSDFQDLKLDKEYEKNIFNEVHK